MNDTWVIKACLAASLGLAHLCGGVARGDRPEASLLLETVIGAGEQWMLENVSGEAIIERSVRGAPGGRPIDVDVHAVWSGEQSRCTFPAEARTDKGAAEPFTILIRGRTDNFFFNRSRGKSRLVITRGRPEAGQSSEADGLIAPQWLDVTIAPGERSLPADLKKIMRRAAAVSSITFTASQSGSSRTVRMFLDGRELRRLVIDDEFGGLPTSYWFASGTGLEIQTSWTWKQDQGGIVPLAVERVKNGTSPGADGPYVVRSSVKSWKALDSVRDDQFTQQTLDTPPGTSVLEFSGASHRTFQIGADPPPTDRVEAGTRAAVEAGKSSGFAKEDP